MIHKVRIVLGIITTLTILVAGCAPSNSGNSQNSVNSPSPSKPQFKVSKTPIDGSLASIQQVKSYPSLKALDTKLYKLFYWSNGKKVEAFLSEPAKSGKYPLLLNLHGGAAWRIKGTENVGYTAKVAAYLANSHTVMVYPEYEGYMDSQGQVMGIKTDMQDVENALKAASSMGEAKQHDVYVEGYSLGGALALMTAAQNHDVQAVVAVSPFAGLTDFMTWARKNAKPNTIFYKQMKMIQESYGKTVNSPAYKGRSPNVQEIEAPALLLQGTADKRVPWQTVQTLANQMKAAHKTVKLVLYKGGQHGLHSAPYQSESTQQMNAWFEKYGLNMQPK